MQVLCASCNRIIWLKPSCNSARVQVIAGAGRGESSGHHGDKCRAATDHQAGGASSRLCESIAEHDLRLRALIRRRSHDTKQQSKGLVTGWAHTAQARATHARALHTHWQEACRKNRSPFTRPQLSAPTYTDGNQIARRALKTACVALWPCSVAQVHRRRGVGPVRRRRTCAH